MANNDSRELVVSRGEAHRLLGVGLSTLKALLARGELRQIRVGRRSLIPRDELERYIATRLAAEVRHGT